MEEILDNAAPNDAAKSAFLAHVRTAVRGETDLLVRLGQGTTAGVIERAIVAAIGLMLVSAPPSALELMVEQLDADAAELARRQAEVNAAHPEDGTVLPEAQLSEDAPPPSAVETPAEGPPSEAPVGGSEEPSEADQLGPGPTDTSEGLTPAKGKPS